MYSMVLMTALVASSASPNWGHRCHGCYSAPVGCTYQGGFACSGCYGCGGQVPGYGAAGGCYGYHGGCYGAFGNAYMDPYGVSNGCYGCYGGHSCYGVPLPGFAPVVPGFKMTPPVKDPFPPINPDVKKDPKVEEVNPPKEKDKKEKKLEESEQARAKVRIEVPVGGKLFVDGRLINVAPGTRVFQTPPLAAGEAYFYDIRIEIDDRREQRRVVIHAGQDALVSFPALRSAAPSTVQVER